MIRPLHRVLGAQALSSLGTSISTVALAVMVFDLSGSVLHMGGVLAASAAPLVVMSFVGGALLDKYEGRRLMVVSDVARAALVLSMPVAASQSVGLIYLVAGVIGVFSALFNPSQVRVIGLMVSPDRLVKANSYLSVFREGAEIGGYLVGGALVASLGYFATFTVDAATYGVSALLLLGLPRAERAMAESPELVSLVRGSVRAVGGIWGSRRLRTNLLLALLPFPFLMMGTPNAYGLALDVFDKGPQGFALMEVLTSGGWIAGGLIAGRMNFKGDRNSYVYWSAVAMAVCMVAVGLSSSFWLAVAFLVLGAVANVGLIVGSMTLYQEIQERPDKGRMIAIRAGFGQMSMTLGLLGGGILGEYIGITTVFWTIGVAAIVLGTVVYLPYRMRGGLVREGAGVDSDREDIAAVTEG